MYGKSTPHLIEHIKSVPWSVDLERFCCVYDVYIYIYIYIVTRVHWGQTSAHRREFVVTLDVGKWRHQRRPEQHGLYIYELPSIYIRISSYVCYERSLYANIMQMEFVGFRLLVPCYYYALMLGGIVGGLVLARSAPKGM